jgi:hypothetical protein
LSQDSDGTGATAGSDGKTMASGSQVGADAATPPVPGPARPAEAEAGAQAARTDDAQAADPVDAAPATPKADDEHAELERLRAEVRDLRTRQTSGEGGKPGKRGKGQGRWRAPVSSGLVVLACILAPLSVLGVWASNQVSSTDRYVATMAPLIDEPPIQHALSAKITTQITSRVNVAAVTSQAEAQLSAAHLPRLANLVRTFSGQIVSGVNSAIGIAVARVVASPAMRAVWVNVNRIAHAGVVRVLSGQGGGAVDVVNGNVVLQLGPLITEAKKLLVAQGLTIVNNVPAVNATFPLFAAPNLAKAQQGYRLINTLRWVLPLLAIVAFAAGIYVARRHRRALIGAALGLAASMLVLGIALDVARGIYLNSVPQSVLPSDAAGALYDTLIRFIREGLRVLLVVGLVIAIGAYLTGPSAAAVRTRKAVRSGIDWLRERGEQAGVRTGPVGEWTDAHKTVLRVAAVGIVALIFVFWGEPSLAVVITLVIILLVLLGLIELIGGRSAQTQAAAQR